jgi:putative Ca2+/H+ antiporter (TMEM165/GDT1 family)
MAMHSARYKVAAATPSGQGCFMEALFTSTAVVAIAEIGDKTQLLAMVLAARFRRPLPIVAGILVATLANHFLAALAGSLVAGLIDGAWFRYAVGISFLAMAAWTLVPDKLDDDDAPPASGGSVFWTTTVAFFIVEIGDKTQVATIALGAQYGDAVLVTLGTTAGMMLANAPVVWLGDKLVNRVPMGAVRSVAAALFAGLGIWVLLSV